MGQHQRKYRSDQTLSHSTQYTTASPANTTSSTVRTASSRDGTTDWVVQYWSCSTHGTLLPTQNSRPVVAVHLGSNYGRPAEQQFGGLKTILVSGPTIGRT